MNELRSKIKRMNGMQLFLAKYGLFIVVTVITTMFFISNADSILSALFQAIRAIITSIMQIALPGIIFLGYFDYFGVKKEFNKTSGYAIRFFCLVAWIGTLYFGTMALKGFTLAEAQNIKEKTYYNSEYYKEIQNKKLTNQKIIEQKQKQLDIETKNYEESVKNDSNVNIIDGDKWNKLNAQVEQKEKEIKEISTQIINNKNAGLKESGGTIQNLRAEISKKEKERDSIKKTRDNLKTEKTDSSTIIQQRIDKINKDISDIQNISESEIKVKNTKKSSYEFAFGINSERMTSIFYFLMEFIAILATILIDYCKKNETINYTKIQTIKTTQPIIDSTAVNLKEKEVLEDSRKKEIDEIRYKNRLTNLKDLFIENKIEGLDPSTKNIINKDIKIQNDKIEKSINKSIPLSTNNKIEMEISQENKLNLIDLSHLKEFIDCIFENIKDDNQILGNSTISKKTGIKESIIQKIKYILIECNILELREAKNKKGILNKKTYAIKNKIECYKILGIKLNFITLLVKK